MGSWTHRRMEPEEGQPLVGTTSKAGCVNHMKTSSVNSDDDQGQYSIREPKCQKATGGNG